MASVLSSSLDIPPESSIPGGDQVGGILVVLFIVTAVILFVGASDALRGRLRSDAGRRLARALGPRKAAAALAGLAVLVLGASVGLVALMRHDAPDYRARSKDRAAGERREAQEMCAQEEWSQCIEAYGFAAELDPEGDTPEMQAAVAHAWEMMRTSGPGTPAAKARAARLRAEARAACAVQQWNTCFASYERAASLDPDGDTPEMKAEHDEALAEARKQER